MISLSHVHAGPTCIIYIGNCLLEKALCCTPAMLRSNEIVAIFGGVSCFTCMWELETLYVDLGLERICHL